MRHVCDSIFYLALAAIACGGTVACAPQHEGSGGMGVEVAPAQELPPGWSEENGTYVFEATDSRKSSSFSDDRGVITMNELVRRKVMVRNNSTETLGVSTPPGDGGESDVAVCACEPGGTVYLGALPPGGCMVLVFKLKTDTSGEKESHLNYLGAVDFKLSGTVDPAATGFQFSPGSAEVSDPTIGACGS